MYWSIKTFLHNNKHKIKFVSISHTDFTNGSNRIQAKGLTQAVYKKPISLETLRIELTFPIGQKKAEQTLISRNSFPWWYNECFLSNNMRIIEPSQLTTTIIHVTSSFLPFHILKKNLFTISGLKR